jgi:hypothetical protein
MTNVPTNRYHSQRDGANQEQTLLTVGNVNVNGLRKSFAMFVVGQVYGQLLVLTRVNIATYFQRSATPSMLFNVVESACQAKLP